MSWVLGICHCQASIYRPGYIRQTKPCFGRGVWDSGSNSKVIDTSEQQNNVKRTGSSSLQSPYKTEFENARILAETDQIGTESYQNS